jgi:hypothetical protein
MLVLKGLADTRLVHVPPVRDVGTTVGAILCGYAGVLLYVSRVG